MTERARHRREDALEPKRVPLDVRLPGTVAEGLGGPVSDALELPRLYDPPLVLRAFTPADAGLVVEASSDPLIPLITTVPPAADAGAVRAFLDRQHQRAVTGQGYSFAIADARTDRGQRAPAAR